jgi:hypothetical protein
MPIHCTVKFDNLPSDICLNVISNWIFLEDLCHYDSSICNKEHRIYFLALIGSIPFSIIGTNSKSYSRIKFIDYIEWISLKLLKVRTLYLFAYHQICVGSLIHSFEQIKKLELVYVTGNLDCTSEILTTINNCKLLNDLTIYDVVCFNEFFEYINGNILNNLHKLKIYSSRFIPIGVQVAQRVANFCSRLVKLHMFDDREEMVPGFVIQLVGILNANANLLCIVLETINLDDSVLIAISQNCRKVQRVCLSRSSKITLGAMLNIRENCTALSSFHFCLVMVDFDQDKHLDVLRNFRILKLNDVTMVRVSGHLSLSSLSLSRVTEIFITKLILKRVAITSKLILSIARNSPNLELLCIRYCNRYCGEFFSLQSMLELTLRCLHLSHIHLGSCYQLSPHDIENICIACNVSLQVISISDNAFIRSEEIMNIVNSCHKLEEVCLINCELISPLLVENTFHCDDENCDCLKPTFHKTYNKKQFEEFFDEQILFDCF